ncbi:MAG TPA: hypothetical protein VM487_07645 [Phycisphaerae bacterium]|nr:hypothetical protein [Phycisphaerae bacterium]
MSNASFASNVDSGVTGDHGPGLTAQQRAVVGEVTRLDAQLANMYLGAIRILHDERNPDRFALAAHGLRELIEKIGERLGAPTAGGPSLTEKVRQLREKWRSKSIPTVYDKQAPLPTSNRSLRDFLNSCEGFFGWFDESIPTRRERLGTFFAATDPAGRRLVRPIEELLVNQWLDVRDQLVAVAHHRKNPTRTEFRKLLETLESLLVERLRPKVFEQQDELDQIIAEGEGNS